LPLELLHTSLKLLAAVDPAASVIPCELPKAMMLLRIVALLAAPSVAI
jgi:hypothetical protein